MTSSSRGGVVLSLTNGYPASGIVWNAFSNVCIKANNDFVFLMEGVWQDSKSTYRAF